jgi:hypothetical protein
VEQADEEHREGDRLDLRGARRQQRQHVLKRVLEQQHDGGADHRAGEVAEAAGDRHQQVFDARADVERRRADEAVLVRVEPARDSREERGDDEERKPHPHRVGADAREQRRAAAQAAHRAPRARVEQVAREGERCADEEPDHDVDGARIGERPGSDAKRRHVRDAAVAAERFEVAEDDHDRQAPRDRRQRQVVPTEAQRHRADDERRDAGQGEREDEAEPRRRAVHGRQPCARVRGDADERRLPERRRAADAGQQHEAERDERGDADVVEERDGEAAADERSDRERSDGEDDERAPHRRAAHVSISSSASSPCGSA